MFESLILNSLNLEFSAGPQQTEALGQRWGREARPGWVIGLTGDLGAGKTQLVKGLARGLGITSRVQSPSFALLNQYSGGRLLLVHIDLYRLENEEQIIGAGLEEYLYQPPGVTVIEWIERWIPDRGEFALRMKKLGTHYRFASIEVASETERRISYEDFGA